MNASSCLAYFSPGPLEWSIILGMVGVGVSCIPVIFYLITLQKALSRCSLQNRTLSSGLVWLQLIPVFNLVWHFVLVINIAKSLHAELKMRNILEEPNPGQGVGLAMCILSVISIIPYLGILTGIAAFICWIIYWVKIAEISSKIGRFKE